MSDSEPKTGKKPTKPKATAAKAPATRAKAATAKKATPARKAAPKKAATAKTATASKTAPARKTAAATKTAARTSAAKKTATSAKAAPKRTASAASKAASSSAKPKTTRSQKTTEAAPPKAETASSAQANDISDRDWAAIFRRAIFMVLFGVVSYILLMVVFLIAAVQFIVSVVLGKPNEKLTSAISLSGSYLTEILDFLCFKTEELPFPFGKDLPEE